MKEKEEPIRFSGQPAGYNFTGKTTVPVWQVEEDLKKIKSFAKINNLELKQKKNQPAILHLPKSFFIIREYGNALKKPVSGTEITYMIQYTTGLYPIWVKKNWIGYESSVAINENAPKSQLLYRAEIEIQIEKGLEPKGVKQAELGKFNTIEDALERISIDIDKN